MSKAPKIIAINHDDHYARYVGRTAEGRQFFLTNPFVPATGDTARREFLALFIFDPQGRLLEARIDDLGAGAEFDEKRARALTSQRIAELGPVEYRRIEITPFAIERFNTVFGFIVHAPDEEDDPWCVELEPGNYMAFFEPWDSGEYDT